jgi:hypothetical protein
MSLIKISSASRTSGTSSNFQLNLGTSKLDGKYKLKSAYIPNSAYNITSSNNTFYFTSGGTADTATIAVGYYNSGTLTSALQTAMDAVSSGFTVTYNTIQGTVTIANATAFVLNNSITTNSLAPVLGFTATDTSSSTSVTSTGILNLSPITSFNINISDQNGIILVNTNSSNATTFVIPIVQDTSFVCYYEPTDGFDQVVTFAQTMLHLNIAVTDDQSNVLPLLADWYIIIEKINYI